MIVFFVRARTGLKPVLVLALAMAFATYRTSGGG